MHSSEILMNALVEAIPVTITATTQMAATFAHVDQVTYCQRTGKNTKDLSLTPPVYFLANRDMIWSDHSREHALLLHGGAENCLSVKVTAILLSREKIKTCQPNPCKQGGKCLTLNEKEYACNCEGTGYKGSHCETGHVVTPIFPKLLTNTKSGRLFLLARPLRRLKVILTSEKEVAFQPQSVVFDPLKIMEGFTVLAEKPGIRKITYDLQGESENDFEVPTPGVLFSAPKMFPNGSLSTKLFLRKGELPTGCEEQQTKVSCEARLISTAPWTKNPPSTNGIVHITAADNLNIPLSLIGLNPRNGVSRDKMIEAGMAMTSSSKQYALLHLRNGTCQARLTDSNSLLELIQNDAFVSSFMGALSSVAPDWLSFSVDENNNLFNIQNIAASLVPNLEHCPEFPLNSASSLVYYRPTVNYKIRVAQTDVYLFADGTTCFAIDICKPGLLVSLSIGQANILKSSLNIFQDMQDKGLSLHVDSIGIHKDKETARFVNGFIWNGQELQELSPFHFNMWLKGNLNWKFGIPKRLLLTLRMSGDAIIRSERMDSLFTTLMSQRMDMQLRGEASLNVSGRVLRKDFILRLGSIKASGKAILGGKAECSKKVQGIFLTLEKSSNNFLEKSPFATYIWPIENQHIRLAILMSVSRGMQDNIVNIGEVKSFLSSIISLIPDLQYVIVKAKEVIPHGEIALEKSFDTVSQMNASVTELEKMITGDTVAVTRALTLLNRIENKFKYLLSIIDVIIDHIPSSSNKGKYAVLSNRIDGIQARFPTELRLNLDGESVNQAFNGISFHFRGKLCLKNLCLKDLSTTLDYLTERNCVSNTTHTSVFRGRGEALRQMALSQDNILTLPMGHVVEFFFPRDSKEVSGHFAGISNLLAVNQYVNVSLTKNQLSFEMQGKIFDRYMANMNVVAVIGHASDWSSLIFAVNGRMTNSSQLPNLLQRRVTAFVNFVAERAVKRVERCERSISRAEEKLQIAKELVKKKKSIFDEALLEKQRRLSRFQRISTEYGKASLELESSLDQFLKVKNRKICQFLSCDFIDSNTYIPAVCQKPVFVNYTVPVCRRVKDTVKEEVIVSKVEKKIQMIPSSTHTRVNKCGGGFLGLGFIQDFFFGCDSYTVSGPMKRIESYVTKNFHEYKTKEIQRFICDSEKMETVISGYHMYECPKNESIKVLDPACVSHNTNCSFELDSLAAEIEFENETMFRDFQDMLVKGKHSTRAQLELNKAEIKFESGVRQLELVRARLQQREFARKAINLNTVKQREKLGLKIGENIKKRRGKPLIYVESLAFSVALTSSSAKTRFPLTVYVRTFEGLQKAIQFPMDFKNEDDSLALASKRIVNTLFGTPNVRRRRSLRDEFIISKANDTDFSIDRHECHLSKEAHILFSDIVESMYFSIESKRGVDQSVFAGIKGIEELNYDDKNDGNNSYSDMIQFLKNAQLNITGTTSWSDILSDARGFLDVMTQRKNFTQCSGISDCAGFFFDSLDEMYEMENHPRAFEIKDALHSLNKIISSILRENITVSLLERKLSRAKSFISGSNDEMILCGQKPTIRKNSPVKVVALLGEDID
ncbi:hypothetical protein AWC38_SpisGene6173 [Stylophora pistillata]|uniref:EGF-like domain-containing protein n=1 Tax=Stylophora pistillata TaxID=50429 RepID=A0A2B4SKU0_STYPI|nr:hypothetical protein AWC38_SpisGene6173 [Stylophora pistillata]